MISRRLKHFYYILLQPFMFLNALLYKQFRSPRNGAIYVQLGPGKRNYFEGWINVDANLLTAKLDVWANIQNGLPFRNSTIDAFYSHQVIEHLPDSYLANHFREMFRCLKPGGVIRIGCPNTDSAIRKYVEQDADWFSDFPDRRESLGGKFANFVLCRGEHFSILTPSYLEEIATTAGFEHPSFHLPVSDTSYPSIFTERVLSTEWETTPDIPHTLILEARKPNR